MALESSNNSENTGDKNNNDGKLIHIIGIGASAGGLEALQEFFSPLPFDTGAAFIVVQHLSPDFKSMMPELLAKHTTMPIHQVEDGMVIKPDNVYLMPARKNMLIGDGKLLLSDQNPDNQLHMPIDVFFRSLAEDQQHRAIGIVLSGTGSDGTRGIKAMKESGGLVIVQEPGSAKFNGMPMSAYNTGLADVVLAPKDMAQNLVNFIKHPSISGDGSALKDSIDERNSALAEIFQLLRQQSSINFSQYKASTVARRIERRLGINQLETTDQYLKLLSDSPRELQILSKELLIGVTRFFRDDEAFAKITQNVIPKIIQNAAGRKDGVRLWVAGCSSGEEAYSLAMLCDEAARKQNVECNLKIFATDVDDDAIAEASNGVYSLDIMQDVSETRLSEYFNKKEDGFAVSQRLRQMVIFASHNMIEDPPFSNIDMVTCRNVLIYFQHAAQKKVLSSLYFALKRDGYLFLGSSESLGDLQSHFEVMDERCRIFKKVSNVRVPISTSPPSRGVGESARSSYTMAPVAPLLKPTRYAAKSQFSGVLERLIEEYAPDCVVVSESFEALHVYGDVSRYMKGVRAGKISNNIKDMVVDELSVALSTALYRCEKDDQDIFYKDIALTISETQQILIDLSIFVVTNTEHSHSPRYYVIQFLQQKEISGPSASVPKIAFDANEQSRQRIRDLEQELLKKQEHLQVIIEELETTNEELQSANEELMSANEELQSTNEELQSVNEELYTVNSEYQEKIHELTEVNDDLDSVINATDIGIVFLDESLTIRKFTPPACRYINMRHSDIERPFHHISHELHYDNFMSDITEVSRSGEGVERNIISKDNHALLMRIAPYHRNSGKTQSGILVTITNVSRQRFMEEALKKAQEDLRSALLDRSEQIKRRNDAKTNFKVLLLDDDEVDRKRVARYLGEAVERKYELTACSEMDEAIASLKEKTFDILLVDYQLAGGTAKDFIDASRKLDIDTPAIVLSAYSEVGLDTEFLNNDIYDFLNKDDLSTQLLCRSIDYVIGRRDVQDVLDELSSAG